MGTMGQVEHSILGGACEGFGSGVRGSGEGLDKSDKPKMTEARQPECLRHNSSCESSRCGADPLPGNVGTGPHANFLSVLS